MRLLYIPRKIIASLGMGRLYNWDCTQPQFTSAKYGYLYNSYAARDTRNLASDGWHVQTKTNLETLRTYLGGTNYEGGKLKETGTTYWQSPNTGATNEVGFNVKGGGWRGQGVFSDINTKTLLMTSTSVTSTYINTYFLSYNNTNFYSNIQPHSDGGYIRLVKDSTTLTHGQTSTYTGNDGKVYPTICIGGVEWLATNLCETKYRNGDAIPEVTGNSEWTALTSGARCSYNNSESNAIFTTSIAPSGWHVPIKTDWESLVTYLGGNLIAGGKLKESGYTHWETDNMGTNEFGFNGVGSGARISDGIFDFLKIHGYIWSATSYDATRAWEFITNSATLTAGTNVYNKKYGLPIRLLKDDSTNPGSLTDIDGNVYPTVTIGSQVWTAANYKCTKFADGTPIPNITDNTEWASLTTPGMCIYGNNPLNL